MNERIEEGVLVLVAIAMLSYMLPFSITRNIAVTVIVALLLMALLILRSIAWHKDGITPFDGIMVIGIGVTIAYLASFTAFSQNGLNIAVLLLFAAFYIMIAVMLYQHRFMPQQPRVKHLRTWKVKKSQPVKPSRAEFKKGVEPIVEHAPPWEKKEKRVRWYHKVFNLEQVEKLGIEPLPERPPRWYNRTMVQDTARPHTAFRQGMEPIHEITPEHLHKMGVYDTEPRRKKS